MDLYQFKKDILKMYGISHRAGNGALNTAYLEVTQSISNCDGETIKDFIQLLRNCKFPRHAERLESLYNHNVDEKKIILTDDLNVTAICEHCTGPARGHSTLSLGERIVNQGLGWMTTEPIRTVVVKSVGFKIGEKLAKLPEGAVPVEIFFGKNVRKRRTPSY